MRETIHSSDIWEVIKSVITNSSRDFWYSGEIKKIIKYSVAALLDELISGV